MRHSTFSFSELYGLEAQSDKTHMKHQICIYNCDKGQMATEIEMPHLMDYILISIIYCKAVELFQHSSDINEQPQNHRMVGVGRDP